MGHARALITIENENRQVELLHQILKKGLNVRQVESLVRDLNGKTESQPIKAPEISIPLQGNFFNFFAHSSVA